MAMTYHIIIYYERQWLQVCLWTFIFENLLFVCHLQRDCKCNA